MQFSASVLEREAGNNVDCEGFDVNVFRFHRAPLLDVALVHLPHLREQAHNLPPEVSEINDWHENGARGAATWGPRRGEQQFAPRESKSATRACQMAVHGIPKMHVTMHKKPDLGMRWVGRFGSHQSAFCRMEVALYESGESFGRAGLAFGSFEKTQPPVAGTTGLRLDIDRPRLAAVLMPAVAALVHELVLDVVVVACGDAKRRVISFNPLCPLTESIAVWRLGLPIHHPLRDMAEFMDKGAPQSLFTVDDFAAELH